MGWGLVKLQVKVNSQQKSLVRSAPRQSQFKNHKIKRLFHLSRQGSLKHEVEFLNTSAHSNLKKKKDLFLCMFGISTSSVQVPS